jgi:cytochrome c biogenesis protein CcmG, thiol:disulfide interchange protein DsbE
MLASFLCDMGMHVQGLRLWTSMAAVAASLWMAAPAWSIEVGAPAPPIELPGLASPVSLAAMKGKLVYVDFWASWCGPCRKSFPWLNEMQAKYGARGLQVVGVNLDKKRSEADKFLAEVPASFTIAFDAKGDTGWAYGLMGMPSSYLVGPDGKIVQTHTGFRDEQRQQLEAAIVAALPKAAK